MVVQNFGGFNAFTTQSPIRNPDTRDLNAGAVFDGRGHDFLSPNDILKNVDHFSQSVSANSNDRLANQLFPPDPFGSNPDSTKILLTTTRASSKILSPGFGANLFLNSGVNQPQGNQSTQSGATFDELSRLNPLIWQNPSDLNILFGIMDAQNKIYGGNGIIPPFNSQPPLFPFNPAPPPPFQDFQLSAFQSPGTGNNNNQPINVQIFPVQVISGFQQNQNPFQFGGFQHNGFQQNPNFQQVRNPFQTQMFQIDGVQQSRFQIRGFLNSGASPFGNGAFFPQQQQPGLFFNPFGALPASSQNVQTGSGGMGFGLFG